MDTQQIVILSVVALTLILYFRRWMRIRGITQLRPSEISEQVIKDKSSILLDVRTSQERSGRHIKGSIHIPLQELTKRLNELSNYKEKQIICYCQSGSRSMVAASMLQKKGFAVANLKGGMAEWNYQRRTA
jgi:rhodanese-related sulfurtransferase